MSDLTKNQLNELLSADDDELYSLLGAAALAVDASPLELLEAGRRGQFYQSPPAMLGAEGHFRNEAFEDAAKAFLRRWGVELRKALCGNEKLLAEEKKRGIHEVDVMIATVIASITATIPVLAGFGVLLNVLAVIVVRSGISAFCGSIAATP